MTGLQKELTDSIASAKGMDSSFLVKAMKKQLDAVITGGKAAEESTDIAELDEAIAPFKVIIPATYASMDLVLELLGLLDDAESLIGQYGCRSFCSLNCTG